MSPKKKTRTKTKKKNVKPKTTPKTTRGPKPKAKPHIRTTREGLTLALSRAAAGPDDPIGACQFTNSAGQLDCVDNITKSQCSKLKNSNFLVGETCQ
jgi:hypothetical protein